MDSIQQKILRSNHTYICENVDLKRTDILDKLQKDLVINSDEADEIINFGAQREQTSHLLNILKKKDSSRKPFHSLVKVLKPCYGHITGKLLIDLENEHKTNPVAESNSRADVMCIYCFLLRNLIPNDISHNLYEKGAFTDDELEEINDNNKSRRKRVKQMLDLLAKDVDNEKISETLREYMKQKFNCAYQATENHITEFTLCCCEKKKYHKSKRNAKPNLEGNLSSQFSDQDIILPKTIQKSSTNDTKLMKKLSRIWNKFWFLRERGNWNELENETTEAFLKYSENPDLLVFLYRSEMCTSTFYREDKKKATLMFNKAKKLLQSTTMSNWHLGRLYALRIEMCIRNGKLGKAEKLIIQGQQELATLAPCLATGTLYFFEGLYYSDLLRRNCRGSKASEIFERAKKCFLLSIEHHRGETLFAIQTWRNEVYLFLTLLEMHVDFKKFNDIDVQRPNESDIPMVKHYLDLFENECWEIATPWSKMLYSIARAKQHQRKDNLQRCVDYFYQAKEYAEGGKFKDQIPIIKDCLVKLNDRLYHRKLSTYVTNESQSSSYEADVESESPDTDSDTF